MRSTAGRVQTNKLLTVPRITTCECTAHDPQQPENFQRGKHGSGISSQCKKTEQGLGAPAGCEAYASEERFNGGTCLSIHLLFWLEIRMRRTVFGGAFILFCLLGGVGGVICRSCNLSIPFHGCLLDFGTCRTKPGQYCIKEVHIKGGIQWYSVQGCTESQDECFKRIVTTFEIHSTHCCHRPLCNF
eukprot:XP_007112261.1 LOW QUALITY PROTEIN: uncharacterized protein C9orf57 homolog [Physeter catodon]